MNPFTMVYGELWQMLLEHPRFVRDVKEGNRIRFDKERDPLKETVQDADMPQVTLVGTTGSANVMDTSSSSKVVRQYTFMISTGDLRYTEILGQVEWYVFCALCGWKGRLGRLQWDGQNFVKRVNVVSVVNGINDAEANKNLLGWSAAWSIEVEMHFQTSTLQSELRACEEGEN